MTFGIRQTVRTIEDGLTRELGLLPVSLPVGLAELDGVWHEQPVHLRARAYAGERIRYARFVELWGAGLEIGNILCLSAPEYSLPILGVDLVDLGRDTAVVVADLSPVASASDERARELEVVRRHRGPAPSPAPSRELPPWATPWFSSEAISTRVPSPRAADVLPTLSAYASAFVELARSTARADDAGHVASQHAAYSAAHRESDRGLQLLGKIFSAAVADRFLREVLFPERLES